jgi:hypothetical protein
MVRDELNNIMSGIDDLEIDDWNIGTSRQVND